MSLPNHVGIIPDGNRRWAKLRGLKCYFGYWYGAKKLIEVLKYIFELGVREVSVYTLSLENIRNREKKEIKELFKIYKYYLKKFLDDKFIDKYNYMVRINFFGNFSFLPVSLVKLMKKIMEKTSRYNQKILNILVAYSGTYEIVNAINQIIKKNVKFSMIDEKEIRKFLLIKNDVDLIIRTGGYYRLSNFLPFQSAYAEIYVIDKLWPDITRLDILKAFRWYSAIQRNFGR